ncbi:MAG: inorganic pyrophosphatase [Clostridiales bacterium]|nr:inorganic pyrophosphatase [Clostridiales bacterium]MCM1436009.1 inorganic pyrophosphatase [Ruminococcus flavefaciens]
MIGDIVTVTVDRPLGSYHPKYKDMYYPINYGYIEGIIAPDGEEQDAYILGVDEAVEKFTGKIIAVIHRSDDVEEKWVVCPKNMSFTKEEIMEQVKFQEKYYQSEIISQL